MTAPSWQPRNPRFFAGLIALAVVVACGVGIPMLEGRPSLLHSKRGELVFLYLVLPMLFVAVWGVTTGRRQLAGTKQDAAQSKAKGVKHRLKLGCAAFLIAPIGSAAVGFFAANASHVHPMDRSSTIAAYSGIGFFAGCVVAVFILLSSIGE